MTGPGSKPQNLYNVIAHTHFTSRSVLCCVGCCGFRQPSSVVSTHSYSRRLFLQIIAFSFVFLSFSFQTSRYGGCDTYGCSVCVRKGENQWVVQLTYFVCSFVIRSGYSNVIGWNVKLLCRIIFYDDISRFYNNIIEKYILENESFLHTYIYSSFMYLHFYHWEFLSIVVN